MSLPRRGKLPSTGRNRMMLEEGKDGKTDPLSDAPPFQGGEMGSLTLAPNCQIVDKVGMKARDDSLRGNRSARGASRTSLLARNAGPPLGGRG
jgi:hypothetical protein